MDREPCPYRIVNDCGGAFAMGAIGGAVFSGFKGCRNAPPGRRLRSGLASIKARSPVIGGNFAAWGGLFSTFDCLLAGIRRKEDAWNAIGSGAITGAVLSVRGGPVRMAGSAVVGGVLLALIEGLSFAVQQFFASQMKPVQPQIPSSPMVSQPPPQY